jgi:hypothetical protein
MTSQLENDEAQAILARVAVATDRLQRRLLAGENTAAVRAELLGLDRQLDRVKAESAELRIVRNMAEAQATAETARALAAEHVAKVDLRMAALQPPTRPGESR